MRFLDFKEKFSSFQVITVQDMRNVFGTINTPQLHIWKQKGYIIPVKRGMYVMQKDAIDTMLLANEMNDSYISLESALSYHQMIPEATLSITSVSKKNKESISNSFGTFLYSKISSKLFCGFTLRESSLYPGRFIRIAEKEKALFDLVYLRADLKEEKDFSSLRLHLDGVDVRKLKKFIALVEAPQIRNRLDNFVAYLHAII